MSSPTSFAGGAQGAGGRPLRGAWLRRRRRLVLDGEEVCGRPFLHVSQVVVAGEETVCEGAFELVLRGPGTCHFHVRHIDSKSALLRKTLISIWITRFDATQLLRVWFQLQFAGMKYMIMMLRMLMTMLMMMIVIMWLASARECLTCGRAS